MKVMRYISEWIFQQLKMRKQKSQAIYIFISQYSKYNSLIQFSYFYSNESESCEKYINIDYYEKSKQKRGTYQIKYFEIPFNNENDYLLIYIDSSDNGYI